MVFQNKNAKKALTAFTLDDPLKGSSHFTLPKNELFLGIFHKTSIIDIYMILFELDKSTLKVYEKNFFSFYIIFILKISASS